MFCYSNGKLTNTVYKDVHIEGIAIYFTLHNLALFVPIVSEILSRLIIKLSEAMTTAAISAVDGTLHQVCLKSMVSVSSLFQH